MTYQDAAIKSAEIYYQYLTDNQRGMIEYTVNRIRADGDCYVLALSAKLRFSDLVQIKIHNEIYTQEQIKPIEHDGKQRALKVRPNSEVRGALANAAANDVLVVSDLKFLVKRVENWYRTFGGRLEIPRSFPDVEYRELDNMNQLPSGDQLEAINGALSEPFSYIWGAPGTGKTRFVLARCIMAYIRAGKRVLITAPTNNAVEQTLYGVLSVLEEACIPLDKILRLGLPSHEFYGKYPSLCEDAETARLLTELNDQLVAVERRIAENNAQIELLPEYRRFLQFESSLSRCKAELPAMLDRLRTLFAQVNEAEESAAVIEGKNTLAKSQLQALKSDASKAALRINALNGQAKKYSRGLSGALFKQKYRYTVQQLESEIKLSDELSAKIAATQDALNHYEEQQARLDGRIQELVSTAESTQKDAEAISAFWGELHAPVQEIDRKNLGNSMDRINAALQKGQELIIKSIAKYTTLRSTSESELIDRCAALEREKAECLAQKREIEADSPSVKLGQCLVLAATVDTCLSRVLPNGDFRPEQVFLDEAGYCSLIKGAALLSYGCPVTFLGDHMQLPPVCEMNDASLGTEENAPVALWAQSALYAEDVFTKNPYDLYADYRSHAPACFQQMAKYDLTHTYRFGEALAEVLSDCVYPNGFHGDVRHDTEIFYINAPKEPHPASRTSLSECHAIADYVHEHRHEDIGIITPYNNQRLALRQALHGMPDPDEFILTVHGSQGREWDTVLFSVVDTTDMWFTHTLSPISNGLRVVNTAVSRARKKLIIVCDADYWFTQRRQLIGRLLSVAEELE